jgi:hypothetical protein
MLEHIGFAGRVKAKLFGASVDYVCKLYLPLLRNALFIAIVVYFKDNLLRVARGLQGQLRKEETCFGHTVRGGGMIPIEG